MASYSRMTSSYRKFRVYHRYSHPLTLFFLDALLFAAKAVAILCLGWLLYSMGSGLFGNSRNALRASQPFVSQTETAVDSLSTPAHDSSALSAASAPGGLFTVNAEKNTLAVQPSAAEPLAAEQLATQQTDILKPELAIGSVAMLSDEGLSDGGLSNKGQLSEEVLSEEPLSEQASLFNVVQPAADINVPVSSMEAPGAANRAEADDVAQDSDRRIGSAVEPALVAAGQNLPQNPELQTVPFQAAERAEFEVVSLSGMRAEAGYAEAGADDHVVINMVPVAGEIWLRNQDTSDYTVQYGTSTNVVLLEDSIDLFPADADTAIFQFANVNARQEPVFGIVHGVYGSATEARQAIDAMPEQLRQYKPWVRQIDQLIEVVESR